MTVLYTYWKSISGGKYQFAKMGTAADFFPVIECNGENDEKKNYEEESQFISTVKRCHLKIKVALLFKEHWMFETKVSDLFFWYGHLG